MKTKFLILIILLLGNTSFKPGYENKNAGEFIVVKDISGIRISTRWIPLTSTRSARQVKCELVVDGPVPEVISVLYDDISMVTWMKGTKEYYRLKTTDAGHWYSYVQFHIPWPLNNQDCIIKYDVSKGATNRITVVRMTGEPNFLKHFEGVNRIPHMEGSWIFTDLGNNRVRVEYLMFSNQVSKFPRWIVDPIIHENLLETMDAFRSILHERVSKILADNETH
jgi:hypothetical protein